MLSLPVEPDATLNMYSICTVQLYWLYKLVIVTPSHTHSGHLSGVLWFDETRGGVDLLCLLLLFESVSVYRPSEVTESYSMGLG